MKHNIFNEDLNLFYFGSMRKRIMYTEDKTSTVFDTKELAESVIKMLHEDYDQHHWKRHNLSVKPF